MSLTQLIGILYIKCMGWGSNPGHLLEIVVGPNTIPQNWFAK